MASPWEMLLTLPRVKAIEKVGQVRSMPVVVRLGITTGLMQLSDSDYNRYALLLRKAIGALSQTPDGREVLSEVGISVAEPDSSPLTAAAIGIH